MSEENLEAFRRGFEESIKDGLSTRMQMYASPAEALESVGLRK